MVWKGLSKFNTEEDSASEASTVSLGIKQSLGLNDDSIEKKIGSLSEITYPTIFFTLGCFKYSHKRGRAFVNVSVLCSKVYFRRLRRRDKCDILLHST